MSNEKQHGVQLITYADSLGGDLSKIGELIRGDLRDLFPGGVHLLPPFPSTGDRGFAPVTYREIDPSFGSWREIEEISRHGGVMVDLMVNHVSRHSAEFRDYLDHGAKSRYADLFIPLTKMWKDGTICRRDIAKIALRRDQPYSHYRGPAFPEGVTVWTTFGADEVSQQIDIDVFSEPGKAFLRGVLEGFAARGISMVRLDAVAYVTKRVGSSCFLVEPLMERFLRWIHRQAERVGITLLLEVHATEEEQRRLADAGYLIYDFMLPYLVLDALLMRRVDLLAPYINRRPHRQVTMLDCHDGVPVKPDLDGVVPSERARSVVDACLIRGSSVTRVRGGEGGREDTFDVHQICGSYYEMLSRNEDAYVAARAIQLFVPGIPQVYYVGLLAGLNDHKRARESGDGREANRHNYTLEEVRAALDLPVVRRVRGLITLRNTHQAFTGTFSCHTAPALQPNVITLSWRTSGESPAAAEAIIDVASYRTTLIYTTREGEIVRKEV